MTKLSLNIDTRSLRNGMGHVRLRINHRGTSAMVSTGVYVEPQYFITGSLYDPIHRKAYMAIDKSERIRNMVRNVDEFLNDADRTELAGMTANEIKERALGTRTHTPTPMPKPKRPTGRAQETDFLQFFLEYGSSRRTPKTIRSYEYAYKVLCDYCTARRFHTLLFEDIDYSRLQDFNAWLTSTGRSAATIHILESYVRAAYRDGQKRHLVSRDRDPYFDYSLAKIPAKDIDCLTVEQLRLVMHADLSEYSGLQRARDLTMMSFFLCGCNLLDMYEMEAPKAGEVVFVRHKVERNSLRPVHIRIEPELAALLKKYGGRKKLLEEAERVENYETYQRRINRLLRGARLKIGVDITFAKVRRTWATIAASLYVSDRVIDKSMGHVDSSVKDRHYEQYDWSRTAEANRKVIDYVLGIK